MQCIVDKKWQRKSQSYPFTSSNANYTQNSKENRECQKCMAEKTAYAIKCVYVWNWHWMRNVILNVAEKGVFANEQISIGSYYSDATYKHDSAALFFPCSYALFYLYHSWVRTMLNMFREPITTSSWTSWLNVMMKKMLFRVAWKVCAKLILGIFRWNSKLAIFSHCFSFHYESMPRKIERESIGEWPQLERIPSYKPIELFVSSDYRNPYQVVSTPNKSTHEMTFCWCFGFMLFMCVHMTVYICVCVSGKSVCRLK